MKNRIPILAAQVPLHHFKLEMNLLAAHHSVQILLPEFSQKSEPRMTIIKVDNPFEPERLPQVQHSHPRLTLTKSHIGVERKYRAVVGQIAKRIAVEVVAMRKIGCKIGVGPMRRDKFDHAARSCDSMQLAHHSQRVADVFDHVSAYDFIELAVGKRIRQVVEIMNDIGCGARIDVHADSAGNLICPAAYVEYALFSRCSCDAVMLHLSKSYISIYLRVNLFQLDPTING